MSAVPTTPSAAVPARRPRFSALARWITGGLLVAAAITALAIAVWPASETEKARADGERVGEAVSALYAADSAAEVDDALIELHAAAADTAQHAGDRVADQVSAQEDALDRAADGFAGAHTSDDEWSADLYQAELDVAVDDLTAQAEDFRTEGPEVQQAFYDGYQDGRTGSE